MPILGRDGAIRDKNGYDPDTGLYYTGEAPELRVPHSPTQQDAKNAADDNYRRFEEAELTADQRGKRILQLREENRALSDQIDRSFNRVKRLEGGA